MPQKKRTTREDYREYAFSISGRDAAMTFEITTKGVLQIGLTLNLAAACETIATSDVDVALVSKQGSQLNCVYRPPDGRLPVVDFGLVKAAALGLKFRPSGKSVTGLHARIVFTGAIFDLDLDSDEYRSDLDIPDPPAFFPSEAAAEYDARVAKGDLGPDGNIDRGK